MSTRWFGIRRTRQGASARMRDHSAALETVVMVTCPPPAVPT